MFLDFSRKLVGRNILGSYLLRSILMILQIFTRISLKKNQRTSATGQPTNQPTFILLLISEILHQLIGSISHYLLRVLYIPGGAGFLNHQQYHWFRHPFYKTAFTELKGLKNSHLRMDPRRSTVQRWESPNLVPIFGQAILVASID